MMTAKSVTVKETEQFQIDHDQYNKVSCAAKLREIKLISSSYMVRPEAFEISLDTNSTKNSYSGRCTDFVFDDEEGLGWGRFQWFAEIKAGRKTCLKLSCEYLVLYSGFVDCDEGHVEAFFKKVGRFATYPYFRATFSHNVGETGIALSPLPTLSERVD